MNYLSFLVIFQAVFVVLVFAQMRGVSRDGYCTKKEDTICSKRSDSLCKYRIFRFQCPRKCKLCVDKPVVPKHLEKAEKARSAVTEVVQDILKSSILTTNSTKVVNLNQVNEVMFQMERSMGQADLSRKKYKLPELKGDIKEALKLGNTRYARRMLAIALNTIGKSSSRSATRRRRATKIDAKTFLEDLRKDLGDEKFSKLLALGGGKTLMFAIDVTGSMSQEIEAAKAIATEISTFKHRKPPKDYILSWFSDPVDLGGTIYKQQEEVNEFVNAIGDLIATGGGDCPEYALLGMFEAIQQGPEYGSPLFVFTDAPAKDGDEVNVDSFIELAKDYGVTVNFFTEESCLSSPDSTFENYKYIASETGGMYLPIKKSETKTLANFTDTKLGSLTTIKSGGSEARGRRRRSTMDEILIPLDDTVAELIISTTVENNANGVSLQGPSGLVWTEGMNRLSNVAIYIIDSPVDGNWTLQIPVDAGNYRYTVKASSVENINFNHRYMKQVNRKVVELKSPIAGEPTQLELTISGEKQTQKDTLLLDLVDIHGKILTPDLKPKRNDESGKRYSLTLDPPSEQFKLQIRGRTSKNKMFQRVQQSASQAKPLVLKMFYTSGTIKQGGSAFIMLYLFNGLDENQVFSVSFKDTLGYKVSLLGRRPIKRVRGKSKTFLRVAVRYGGRKLGKIGQDENVIILVRYGSRGDSTAEVVTFMVK